MAAVRFLYCLFDKSRIIEEFGCHFLRIREESMEQRHSALRRNYGWLKMRIGRDIAKPVVGHGVYCSLLFLMNSYLVSLIIATSLPIAFMSIFACL